MPLDYQHLFPPEPLHQVIFSSLQAAAYKAIYSLIFRKLGETNLDHPSISSGMYKRALDFRGVVSPKTSTSFKDNNNDGC